MQVDPIQPLEVADLPAFESEEKVIEQVPVYYPELSIADKEVIIPAAGFSKESTDQQINRQDPKTKAQKKKQQQRRRFWKKIGGNLVVGTVFLGIAILLALLHIESLAILFGLASILFLIFGLKKVFKMRRRQIKNPFRKNT